MSACAAPPKTQEPTRDQTEPRSTSPSNIGELVSGEPKHAIAVEADDARLGNDDAKVTLVAYLDFQCAFCSRGFATLVNLRNSYSDEDLRIVFKHLPLESHQQSFPAAIVGQVVTQAAGSAAFFQFARNAFQNQSALSYQALAEWAEEAGVSREVYNEMVAEEETAQRVIQDAMGARRLGVSATPTFYINGKLLGGAQPAQVFHQMIAKELKAMDASKKTHWKDAYLERVEANLKVSLVEALLEEDSEDYRVPLAGSPMRGNPDAAVTLVAFSDYECPFCKKAEETLQKLRQKHGHDLRVIFKHLPLPFHKNAMRASLLAAAVQKNKGDIAFYLASDALFEASPTLDRDTLQKIGQEVGLSKAQIDGALDETDRDLLQRIHTDMELADDVLARGTPHFFINGKRLSGARPFEHFDALIEFEKKRANQLRTSGVSGNTLYAQLQKDALSPGAPQKLEANIPSKGRAVRGDKNALVEIHVFSDFECPYCKQAELNLDQLRRLYPNKLRFVWHDFPLPFHDQARPAARAGREVLAQKGPAAFWKLHEFMFALDAKEPNLEQEKILAKAEELGADIARLKQAMSSEKHDPTIAEDEELADSLGIRGTPAMVIGGYLVTGAKPLRFLKRVVEMSLKEERRAN